MADVPFVEHDLALRDLVTSTLEDEGYQIATVRYLKAIEKLLQLNSFCLTSICLLYWGET